jgi:hypothetical protein
MERRLHCCWLVDEWKTSRERYLKAWQAAGWSVVLWHNGQLAASPVEGIELRCADEIISGAPIERALNYERQHKHHAACADLFRYEVLNRFGGAYCDIDILPGRDATPALFNKENIDILFGRGWVKPRWVLEIRFILCPTVAHPLMLELRDTAVRQSEAFIDSGGYPVHGIDNIVQRTGPLMAEKLTKAYALRKGFLLKNYLLHATRDTTIENTKEHFDKKHPEIRRIAGL